MTLSRPAEREQCHTQTVYMILYGFIELLSSMKIPKGIYLE